MTIPLLHLLLAFVVGVGIGTFYFSGLMWTLTNLPGAKRPGLWLTISFWVRAGIAVTGFYSIMAEDWKRLLVSLAGFMTARLLIVSLVRLKPAMREIARAES